MTPGRLDPAVVSDRASWIRTMLAGIGELPLDSLEQFTRDRHHVAAAESYLSWASGRPRGSTRITHSGRSDARSTEGSHWTQGYKSPTLASYVAPVVFVAAIDELHDACAGPIIRQYCRYTSRFVYLLAKRDDLWVIRINALTKRSWPSSVHV